MKSLGSQCHRKLLVHESRTNMNEINVLTKEPQERSLTSISWELTTADSCLWIRKSPCQGTTILAPQHQTSSLQKWEKKSFVVYKLFSLWHFATGVQADWGNSNRNKICVVKGQEFGVERLLVSPTPPFPLGFRWPFSLWMHPIQGDFLLLWVRQRI